MIHAFFALLSIASFSPITGVFTQGDRHIAWRLDIPEGMDTTVPQPALLEFHGDLGLSEEGVLTAIAPYSVHYASPHKALAITFAGQDVSPELARRLNGNLDGPLMVAAVRANLGGIIKIDTNKIVMRGKSSGGSFLDYVLQKQLFGWGGGMFIQCGTHSVMNDPIPPNRDWAKKYRVFVATTPDDFLYSNNYYPILEHARDWSGYDVRTSKTGSGGHCATPEATLDSAFAWLFHSMAIDTDVIMKTNPARWVGISSMTGIKGVAATPNGVLWFVNSVGGKSYAYKSTDLGATWTSPWNAPDSASKTVGGIANFGETVVISHLRKLVVINASTTTNKTNTKTKVLSPPLTSDGTRIWMRGDSLVWSTDTGSSWVSVPSDWVIPDQFATGAWRGKSTKPPHFVRIHDSTMVILNPSADLKTADSTTGPEGRILSSTRKGDTLLASVWNGTKQVLYAYVNQKWSVLPWPADDGNTADNKVAAIHQLAFGLDSRPYVMGKPSFIGNLNGTWQHMPAAFSAVPEPTAMLADGRILRTANKGFGLMLWTPPTVLRTSSNQSPFVGPDAFRQKIAENGSIRRIGQFLELSREGGPWQVRWLDATGRILASASHAGSALIPLRPVNAGSNSVFVEVASNQTRAIVSSGH